MNIVGGDGYLLKGFACFSDVVGVSYWQGSV